MTQASDATVADKRRAPFFYQTHEALAAIRAEYDGAKRATAIAVYVVLTEAANEAGGEAARDGFVSARKVLARRAGISVDTLDKYMSGLVSIGLVEVVRRKVHNVNLPNTWRLTDPPSVPPSGRTGTARGGRTGAAVKPLIKETLEEEGTSSLTERGTGAPPKQTLVDGQNLAYNALQEGCGIDKRGNRAGQIAVALNGKGAAVGIRELFWREMTDWAKEHDRPDIIDDALAHPASFEEALARAVSRKIGLYTRRMPGAEMTPTALRDWWFDLNTERRQGGGLTADEMRNFDE